MSCITIITSTLNCGDALSKTADSIRDQTYKNIQWIIADGASSDGTLDVISNNKDIVSDSIIEPDTGIYDAWNKACTRIRGEWVIFLGAGDVFYDCNVLEVVATKLVLLPTDIVIAYGNVVQKKNGKEIYRYGVVDLKAWEIYRPSLPAHQGVFQRASSFKGKPFDTQYKVVADSKFMLQLLRNGSAFYLNEEVCEMEPGGVSSDHKNAYQVMTEFLRLEKDLGYRVPLLSKAGYIIRTHVKTFLAYIRS